jgi:hypothetical protein
VGGMNASYGSLSADGGDAAEGSPGAGGGGRIAVMCTGALEPSGPSGLTFSAAGGHNGISGGMSGGAGTVSAVFQGCLMYK